MALLSNNVIRPASNSSHPNLAIIVPLSIQYIFGGAYDVDSLSQHINSHIFLSLLLHATPPPNNNSVFPVCASALSATSTQAENTCSCRLQHTASNGLPFSTNLSAAVRTPENARSIPLTAYGNSRPSIVEFGCLSMYCLASFSITGPPGNGIPWALANLSSILPIPISRVSPRTRYFPSSRAMTWVLPPDTYNRTGSSQPHCCLPISMCATQ